MLKTMQDHNQSESSFKSKKRGRPKGSKNKPKLEQSETTKLRCPRKVCLSSDTERVYHTKSLACNGVKDGQPYDRIDWELRFCRSCKRQFTSKKYSYSGPKETDVT